MRHIGIFENIQEALDNCTLGNPYVATVGIGSSLDYNSLRPTPPPTYKGRWQDPEETGEDGLYEFDFDNTETKWSGDTTIATIPNAYYEGNLCNINVLFRYNENDAVWELEFAPDIQEASSTELFTFTTGETFEQTANVMLEPESSTATIDLVLSADGYIRLASCGEGFCLDMYTNNIVDDEE